MIGSRTGTGFLLAVDVGNTNTVFGIYRGEELVDSLRISTRRERTSDEMGALLLALLRHREVDPRAVDAMIVSSVVPPLRPTIERMARRVFDVAPVFIEAGVKTGMPIRSDHPAEVGADRIVNAVGARYLYGAPVVVVDFGTATTFDVVSPKGEYVGGIIAPGIGISAEALFVRASRLFRVDVQAPTRLIGTNTAAAMQSGIYYGYIGLVDGILERLLEEIEGLERIVATGGEARMIADGSRYLEDVDPDLTLTGLRLIHERNRRG